MKAMQRVFAKYITLGRDVHELLFFLLGQVCEFLLKYFFPLSLCVPVKLMLCQT